MSKIPGFVFDYDCISDGEAFQRNHEYGENYIDVKSLKELKNIKKLIGRYAKVFRNDVIKRIEIEKVTVGDFVLLEKGDIVPADAVVVEAKELVVISLIGNKEIKEDLTNKEIYQGTKVVSGTAIIMVSKIGENTFLANKIKELLSNNNQIRFKQRFIKAGIILSISCAVVCLIMLIAMLIRFWGTGEFYKSYMYALGFAAALVPVEFFIMFGLVIVNTIKVAKSNSIKLKNIFSLYELGKIKIVCAYDCFFNNQNISDMQRLYRAGIRVIMLSNKTISESKKIAVESGLVHNEEIKVVTGTELKSMKNEEIRKIVLEAIVFSEMDSEANELVIKALKSMQIPLVVTGETIEDVVSLKLADFSIYIDEKRNNLESRITNAFVKMLNMKTILELLKIARKFSDSIKKIIMYVVATRIPLIIAILSLIIINNGTFINPLLIMGIYWVVNPLISYAFGTISGNGIILNVEDKKEVFTKKDSLILLIKTLLFTMLLFVVYVVLGSVKVEPHIISYAIFGTIIIGCLIITFVGRNKVKEKIIKPKKEPKQNAKKQIKKEESTVNANKCKTVPTHEKTEESSKLPKKEEVQRQLKKEKLSKALKDENKSKQDKQLKTNEKNLVEKPWLSNEDNKNVNVSKNKAKPIKKSRKQQRTEELKGKIL